MIDQDDPLLTAFAFGELGDEQAAKVQSELDTSPELRTVVDEIRRTGEILTESLQAEPTPALTDAQRKAIEQEAESIEKVPPQPKKSRRRRLALALAASLLLAVGVGALVRPDLFDFLPGGEVARDDAADDDDSAGVDEASSTVLLYSQDRRKAGAFALDPGVSSDPPAETIVGGQTLPSPYYLQDDVEYYDDSGSMDAADGGPQGPGAGSDDEWAAARSGHGSGRNPGNVARADGQSRGSGDGDVDLRPWREMAREGRPNAPETMNPVADLALPIDPNGRSPEPTRRRRYASIDLAKPRDDESPASTLSNFDAEFDSRLSADLVDVDNDKEEESATEAAQDDESTEGENGPTPRRPFGLSGKREDARRNSERRQAIEREEIALLREGQQRYDALQERLEQELEAAKESRSGEDSDKVAEWTKRLEELQKEKDKLQQQLDGKVKGLTATPKPVRTWRRAAATPNASRLVIGDRDELLPQGMQANVIIDGFRARVLLDCYFYNDRDRQLEGNFKLRLPNEASLYYFAFGQSAFDYRPAVDKLASRGFLPEELIRAGGTGPTDIMKARADTWTNVKEARVVPREKAAHAYGETVRRRVDPALVEWSGAGVFNARVFPLMPGKLHRIVIGYDVNLQSVGGELVYQLDLPPGMPECRVDVNMAAAPGTAAEVVPAVAPFTSGGRAYYHFERPEGEPIRVRLTDPGTVMLVGGEADEAPYFATRFTPELPEVPADAGNSHAVFLLDTSLSSRPEKFNIYLDLLEAVLENNRGTMTHFALLSFDVETRWWQRKYVENTPENVRAALNHCSTITLEGATDLSAALAEATSPDWPEKAGSAAVSPDFFLLGDGAVTWGEMNLHLLADSFNSARAGSLFAFRTGLAGTAVGTLEHLARESGGAVFSVAGEDEVPAAAVAHRNRPWQLLAVDVDGGGDLLLAGRPRTVYPGQPLTLVGRGHPAVESGIVLHLKQGDRQETARVPIDRTAASSLTGRVYGDVAVGQFESLAQAAEDVAVSYARHFRVPGRTCSLLMLESEADYQRFNIKPEDDAFVVASSPADELILRKLDEWSKRLADPKANVQHWLAKMEKMPGVELNLPTALRLVVERLPVESFRIEPGRLQCKRNDHDELPKKFAEHLSAERLDYDTIVAEARRRHDRFGGPDALKALSSLIESNPGDLVLARDVAFSAIEWDLAGQAYPLLRRVADARPYEPQIYQAIAQCLAELDRADLAILYYEVALAGKWHDRYQDFHQIARMEYLHLLNRVDRGELQTEVPDFAEARLESLRKEVALNEADLVVTMMWNTDRTDLDLHVIEPTGEECYYQHRQTRSGGRMTSDVTEGFGPEMYQIENAPHGKFSILANYYGSDANRTQVRTKVYVTTYQLFGRPGERVSRQTVTLGSQKEKRQLTTVTIEK